MCKTRPHAIGLFVALLLCLGFSNTFAQSAGYLPTGEFPKTDFDNHSIDIGRILSGGPPRDGIPSVDKPKFVTYEDALEWLAPNEPVISFANGNDARAYPLQILMYHEIVNDIVNESAVAVTFCPLCNASIVFERRVDDLILDFGTTGRLFNSDLIMYDRQTETWWQQFTGKGVIGEFNQHVLTKLPSQIVSFESFMSNFPSGKVLSRDTGFSRPYGRNPYAGYDDINSNPFLFSGDPDDRLPPMERVLGIQNDDSSIVVPLSGLSEHPVYHLSEADQAIVIFNVAEMLSALDNTVIQKSRLIPSVAAFSPKVKGEELTFEIIDGVIKDQKTRSTWNMFGKATAGEYINEQLVQLDGGVHFAFAWLAFNSEAKIHNPR